MPTLHARLKRERKRLSLSQEQLAKLCGVTQPTIANWERGSNIPRQAALSTLAKSLNVESEWLLTGGNLSTNHPAQRHLSTPIRNIPVYDWVETHEEFKASKPSQYLTMSADGDNLFAMRAPNDDRFDKGAVLIFDGSAAPEGQQLVTTKGHMAVKDVQHQDQNLEQGQALGRLMYSINRH